MDHSSTIIPVQNLESMANSYIVRNILAIVALLLGIVVNYAGVRVYKPMATVIGCLTGAYATHVFISVKEGWSFWLIILLCAIAGVGAALLCWFFIDLAINLLGGTVAWMLAERIVKNPIIGQVFGLISKNKDTLWWIENGVVLLLAGSMYIGFLWMKKRAKSLVFASSGTVLIHDSVKVLMYWSDKQKTFQEILGYWAKVEGTEDTITQITKVDYILLGLFIISLTTGMFVQWKYQNKQDASEGIKNGSKDNNKLTMV